MRNLIILILSSVGLFAQDQSAELQKRINETKGNLTLQAGQYRLEKPLVFDLAVIGLLTACGLGFREWRQRRTQTKA